MVRDVEEKDRHWDGGILVKMATLWLVHVLTLLCLGKVFYVAVHGHVIKVENAGLYQKLRFFHCLTPLRANVWSLCIIGPLLALFLSCKTKKTNQVSVEISL